jgi:hypothetical protein
MPENLELALIEHLKVLVNELGQELQRVLHGLHFFDDHFDHFKRVGLFVELLYH